MSQAWFVNTPSQSGGECGTAKSAVFDHAGQFIYVQLFSDQPAGNNQEACVAVQTYKIDWTGAIYFVGATEFATESQTGLNTASSTPPKLSGNGSYAYSASYDHGCDLETYELKRESSGTMLFNTYEILTVPSTPPDWRWYPFVVTADPTNHMAAAMVGASGSFGPCGDVAHLTQLASFTVASDGNLSSTNTPKNMPTPQINPLILNMSPSGKFLAVGGSVSNTASSGAKQTPGLQVFHFNGANPITSFSKLLTAAPINPIRWDNNNHLYALSNSTKKLYAYTVTSSGVTAVPGSPYTIASTPNALVVVPTLTTCSVPTSNGVNICAPTAGSTTSSPVTVRAAATVSGTIARMELWVDGVKKYTATSTQATQHHYQPCRREPPFQCVCHQHRGPEMAERRQRNSAVGWHSQTQKPARKSGLLLCSISMLAISSLERTCVCGLCHRQLRNRAVASHEPADHAPPIPRGYKCSESLHYRPSTVCPRTI